MDTPEDGQVLGMSDDDFAKMPVPTVTEAPTEEPVVTEEPPKQEEVPVIEETPEAPVVTEPVGDDQTDEDNPDDEAALQDKPEVAPVTKPTADDEAKDKAKAPDAKPTEEAAIDYEKLYKEVMAPFKANGKMIDLKDPKELIQLAQMGANFTRKMQEMAPHRKMLTMLQNNNLLDEGKLSFLIDVQNKNPEAIKKLLKESGIDPLDIDTSVEPAYQAGNHRVTDEEVAFRSALEDIQTTDDGKATLVTINNTWDEASKELLFTRPEIMSVMHEQRVNGIYDQIVAEMDRQRTLGSIPANMSFVHAYKTVGDQMVANKAFKEVTPTSDVRTPAPVATRAVAPKATVVNNDKANAAAASRTSPKAAKPAINYLEMADDDFLKQMNHRL